MDLKQHLSVHLFATGTRKPLPFAPFSFGGLLLLLLSLASVARVSSPQRQLSCERFLLSISRVSRCGAPAVRPSAHNTPLGCVWYYCQLVVASGASGDFFPVSFCLSLDTTFCLEVSQQTAERRCIVCRRLRKPLTPLVFENLKICEKNSLNQILHTSFRVAGVLRFEDGWWTRTGPRH